MEKLGLERNEYLPRTAGDRFGDAFVGRVDNPPIEINDEDTFIGSGHRGVPAVASPRYNQKDQQTRH